MSHFLCAIIPVVVVWLFFQLKPKQAESSTADASRLHARPLTAQMRRTFTQRERDMEIRQRVRDTFADVGGEKFEKFVKYAASMPVDEIGAVTSELEGYFKEDGKAAQAWLFALYGGLAKLNAQDRMLDITGYLQVQKEVPDVERRVLYDLSEKSWDQVTGLFSKLAKEEDFIDGRQAAIAVSLALNERSERFGDLVKWIDGLDGKDVAKLQAKMLEKLIEHTDPTSENFKAVTKLLEDHITGEKAVLHLPELAVKMGEANSENALDWVAKVKTKNDEMRMYAYAHVMQDLALKDPVKATEVLSSAHFIPKYFVSSQHTSPYLTNGELRPEAKEFYDNTVAAMMEGLASVEPQIVLDSVGVFFSPEKKEKFTKLAHEMMNTGSMPASNSKCNNPNCNHAHHP